MKTRYNMLNSDIERLTKKVIPLTVERLSMDDRVQNIEIFSDIDFTFNLGLSSKVNIIKSNTDVIHNAPDVIKSYIELTKHNQNILVIYNPLFPFVSIKKIHYLFDRVKKGEANSGIGSYFDAQSINSDAISIVSDRGIFSIVSKEKFLERGIRLIEPIDTVSLSALELVSMRSREDYELYSLIVNAGLV